MDDLSSDKYFKIIKWLLGGDTGASSEAICAYMLGLKPANFGYMAPSDKGDRGRCIRLLNLFPEWWDRLYEMSDISEYWDEQIPIIESERYVLSSSTIENNTVTSPVSQEPSPIIEDHNPKPEDGKDFPQLGDY